MLRVEVTSWYNSKYRVIKSYPMRCERPRHNGDIDTVQHVTKFSLILYHIGKYQYKVINVKSLYAFECPKELLQ